MTIDELIDRIDEFMDEVEKVMPEIADELALNMLALVKNRIIDQRHGIDGARYSNAVMLATKDMFVVKSAFRVSEVEETRYHRNKTGTIQPLKGDRKKVVKRPLWIKFKGASKAVPVMKLERGYQEFREIQGRPGDHVNLSLTGQMWLGTGIRSRGRNQYTWIVVIGGINQEAQQKLQWNYDKYGSFLDLRPHEEELISRVFQEKLQAIWDKYFELD